MWFAVDVIIRKTAAMGDRSRNQPKQRNKYNPKPKSSDGVYI
jgi:hypothetical protein